MIFSFRWYNQFRLGAFRIAVKPLWAGVVRGSGVAYNRSTWMQTRKHESRNDEKNK
jgi:hypothetical protein